MWIDPSSELACTRKKKKENCCDESWAKSFKEQNDTLNTEVSS